MKKPGDRYLKIVEWSDEDQCYVGTAPELVIGGVHGKDQAKVFHELCDLVDEAAGLLKKEGRSLPPALAHKKYSGRILLRIPSPLHKTLAIRALQRGESVNRVIQSRLIKAGNF